MNPSYSGLGVQTAVWLAPAEIPHPYKSRNTAVQMMYRHNKRSSCYAFRYSRTLFKIRLLNSIIIQCPTLRYINACWRDEYFENERVCHGDLQSGWHHIVSARDLIGVVLAPLHPEIIYFRIFNLTKSITRSMVYYLLNIIIMYLTIYSLVFTGNAYLNITSIL